MVYFSNFNYLLLGKLISIISVFFMNSIMVRMGENNKIFKPIIVSYPIYMMNNLSMFKVAFYMLFHDKAVFFYIASLRGMGMVRFPNFNISLRGNNSTTLPTSLSESSELMACYKSNFLEGSLIMRLFISFYSFFWNFFTTSTFAMSRYIIHSKIKYISYAQLCQ